MPSDEAPGRYGASELGGSPAPSVCWGSPDGSESPAEEDDEDLQRGAHPGQHGAHPGGGGARRRGGGGRRLRERARGDGRGRAHPPGRRGGRPGGDACALRHRRHLRPLLRRRAPPPLPLPQRDGLRAHREGLRRMDAGGRRVAAPAGRPGHAARPAGGLAGPPRRRPPGARVPGRRAGRADGPGRAGRDPPRARADPGPVGEPHGADRAVPAGRGRPRRGGP